MLTTSLIITTYNRPDALARVLQSALQQTHLPDEILVADDGSTPDTAQTITHIAQHTSVPIRHIWQTDDGFRAAQIRNRALAAATGEYIVLIDGDMLLHPQFIADHIRVAQHNIIVQGSRVLLSPELTRDILANELPNPCVFSCFQAGVMKKLATIRCVPLSDWLATRHNQHHKAIKSCNMGFFREDALRVNGFNNQFVGWGREDSEFVARLYHAGVQRANLKFAGIAYHLWHNEAERAALPQNDALLQQTLSQRLTRCEHGVNEFL